MPEAVITGLGPVAPTGLGVEQFWEALWAAKSGVRRISRFNPDSYPCQVAGEIPAELLSSLGPLPENVSWSTHLVVTAGKMCLEDAGIDRKEFSARPSGVWVGVSTNDMEVVERECGWFQKAGSGHGYAIAAAFPHAAASRIASELRCSGKVLTLATGCSSGLLSIVSAIESIVKGDTDIALAGGGDAPLTPLFFSSFCTAGFLTTSFNDAPASASRPFDARRSGGVLSEGAGMILLENAVSARLRGAKCYAAVAGWGYSNAVNASGVEQCFVSTMKQALRRACLLPGDIDYICSTAVGDRFLDREEVRAIKKVFGRSAYNIPVSSIKSMTGTPLAACGSLQVIASALAIQNSFAPPTINYQYPDPELDLDFVPNRGRTARINTVLVNLKAFGGNVVSVVLTRP